jgi:sulfate permease, SulP family
MQQAMAVSGTEVRVGVLSAAMGEGKPKRWSGEFWGGLAAMLVALPSAIAFGVTIFAPLGASYAVQGAIAGILGTIVLGFVASSLGGTNRLITAPCAPAAAVLSALAIELSQRNVAADSALLMLALVAALCGVFQVLFGVVGLGKLIKYMPYPVVSGYLSGVGLIIIVSQVPKLLGVPGDTHFGRALVTPTLWNRHGIVVGVVTMAVMLLAPKFTKAVPAAILGLGAGIVAYFGIAAAADHSMLTLAGNKLVIGSISQSAGTVDGVFGRWRAMSAFSWSELQLLVIPALTLAVLLSIDTLKTCVVLDALTRSRHNSNRELIGQGVANIASTFAGGMPGAGQMGATLVNISSGAQTRFSGMIEGVLALAAFLLLGNLIAWVPIAALAAILVVVGVRMFDRHSLQLLRSRSTILDFAVIVAVIVVAKSISLIAASATGIGLAILLFIREQVGGSVVRQVTYGNQMFSKQVRSPEEMEVLEEHGSQTAIFELQGSLFFGTTDQLYSALARELKKRKYVVLDMRRVVSVDVTAAHLLDQVEDMLAERGGLLIFSHFPRRAPTKRDLESYFAAVGIVRPEHHVRVFTARNEALEWIEDRILEEAHIQRPREKPLELSEMAVFKGRKEETLEALEACMEVRSFKAGERIFKKGDSGDGLYLIRRGEVRILLPLAEQQSYHLSTFGRGDFFGEMTFLDREPRSADAVALTDTELFVLSRTRFDALAEGHKRLAMQLQEGLARTLAVRLRRVNRELRAWQEG